MDLVHCRVFPEGMEFVLSATHKWGSSDQLTQAFLARFPSNSRLCLVETSGSDLKATHAIRPVFPLFQGGSVVYLIRKASQTNYGTIHQEVATFATQGFWCQHQKPWVQRTVHNCQTHSVCGASAATAASSNVPLFRDFKDGLLVYSFNFSEVLFQTRLSSTFAYAVLQWAFFSAVCSSWVALRHCRCLDEQLDIAGICLVYL